LSQEAVTTLTAVEERLRARRAAAGAEAKEAVAGAKAQGEQILAAAIKKAEAENAERMRQAEEKAKIYAQEKASAVGDIRETLQNKANLHMEQAIGLIVERIVNG